MVQIPFAISFFYQPESLRGRALITPLDDGEEMVYKVSDIEWKTLPDSGIISLLVPEEMEVRPVLSGITDELRWVDSETGEETIFSMLVGQAIEKHHH